jgi:hypothetical protein
VGARVATRFRIEGAFSYSKPALSTRASSDVENAPSISAIEHVRQFQIEVGFLMQIAGGPGARAYPFVSASGGYLRQLHEGDTFAKDGGSGALGAGVDYFLTRPGRARAVGIRGEIKARVNAPQLSFDDRFHVAPALAVSMFVAF